MAREPLKALEQCVWGGGCGFQKGRGTGGGSVWVEGVIVTVHTHIRDIWVWGCNKCSLPCPLSLAKRVVVLKVSLIKVVYYEVVEYRGGVCSWCKEKVAAGVDNPGSCCVWLGRNGAPSWTPWGFGCDGCIISMLYMWWDNQLLQERTLAYCQATASAAFISSLKGTYQHRATSWSQAQVHLFVCIILIILFIIKCQVQRQ